jgi:hypothetical protein
MTDPLETVLRDSFRSQVKTLDSAAAARLLAIDYRARRPRLPVLPVLGALGLGGATAAVAVALLLGSSAGPAFAGWTHAPSSPAPGQTAAALQQCGTQTPVLTDTRGPYTAIVYALPNGVGTCVEGGSVLFNSTASGGDQGSVPPGQIQSTLSTGSSSSGNTLTVVGGRAGSGVTAVTLERSDGVDVKATVSDGWYLAWWPASATVLTAEITTASGTRTTGPLVSPSVQSAACGSAAGCASATYAPAPSTSDQSAKARHTPRPHNGVK